MWGGARSVCAYGMHATQNHCACAEPQPPAMPPRGKRKSSGQESKKYEEEYEKCSCDELRQKLVELGENPGPIDASNK